MLGTCSFICQEVPRPGDSEEIFLVFELSCYLYFQSNHSKLEAIPLSALLKGTTSELADLSSHCPLMLNVKQGSCKYHLFKAFGLTRRENRIQVYRADALTTYRPRAGGLPPTA